jgi:hypothetical protein
VLLFQQFFKEKQNVVIYVCDSSDDRELARKKKFDFWYWKYNDGTILKVDGIALIAGMQIYNSLLVHKDNLQAAKIIQSFHQLNERIDDK